MNTIKKKGIYRLFGLGFADIIWSILPIVFWCLTGTLWGHKYDDGFIVGYSFQFIVAMLQEMFLLGSLKNWMAENKKTNYFGMGMICYLITGIILCIVLSLFGDQILPLFGYDNATIWGLYIAYAWQFFIDGIAYGISIFFQYQKRLRLSQVISYSWFVLRMISLLVCKFFYKDNCFGAIQANNLFLLVLGLILIIVCIDFKNMKLSLQNWICREGFDISSNFVMFIIYFLGVGDMSSNAVFLAAYNIMTMSSDIQWDLQGSIDTYVATEAADGNWNTKKKVVLKSVATYSMLLCFSSLLLILFFGNQIAFYIWLIEMSLYIPDCIGCYYLSYVSIKYPNKWLCIFGFCNKVVRLCVQLLITSLWGIPISCFVGCFMFILCSMFLYHKSRLRDHEFCDRIKI